MKQLAWVIGNGICLLLLILWLQYSNPYAAGIGKTIVWILGIFGIISLAISTNLWKHIYMLNPAVPKRAAVPAWLDGAYDVIVLALLVTYGQGLYAALYTVQFVGCQRTMRIKSRLAEEEEMA